MYLFSLHNILVATVLTVHGIETSIVFHVFSPLYEVATAPTVYGIETFECHSIEICLFCLLQQYLPFTVCAEGCETAEEQSDDEVRTSLT